MRRRRLGGLWRLGELAFDDSCRVSCVYLYSFVEIIDVYMLMREEQRAIELGRDRRRSR